MSISETRHAAIERLKTEGGTSVSPPCKNPQRLPQKSIYAEPLVFQVRSDGLCSERVAEIERGLNGSNLDEPIHVWWSGQRWIVIEGHHRLAAYQLKREQNGQLLPVPVVVHPDISLEEAMAFAGLLNDREKVKISQADKLDNAWRVVCMGNGSISRQANTTGVAQSTISNMRNVVGILRARGLPDRQLIDASWSQCREWAKGRTKKEYGPDALEAMAHDMADQLRSINLPTTILKSPDVLARALEIISPELLHTLLQSDPFWDVLNTTGRELLREAAEDHEAFDVINADF